MRRNLEYLRARLVVASAAAVLAGCGTITARKAELPTAPLQLIESRPLVLADGCSPTGSYFVEFTVLGDGRTGQVRLPSAPACVREALSAWVGSFRYAPPAQETPAGVEWLLVTARNY